MLTLTAHDERGHHQLDLQVTLNTNGLHVAARTPDLRPQDVSEVRLHAAGGRPLTSLHVSCRWRGHQLVSSALPFTLTHSAAQLIPAAISDRHPDRPLPGTRPGVGGPLRGHAHPPIPA